MDHEAASLLLSDWVAHKLTGEIAATVAEHVANCAECRSLGETLVAVRGEVAEHGQALWSPHPSALDLTRFVTGDDPLETDEYARVGAHLRACPACGMEAHLAREAQLPSAWRWLRAWLPEFMGRRAVPGVAFAALAVMLAYPAYLGLVEYPRQLRLAPQSGGESAGGTHASGTRPAEISTPTAAEIGGPAAVLILTGEARGGASVLPVARLRVGQTQLSVLIDAAPPKLDPVEIELRDQAGRLVWHIRARGAELWDERQHVMSLAIPVAGLAGNEFMLSLGVAGRPAEVNRRFRVVPAQPPAASADPRVPPR
jgi:hypothetical protein